MSSPDLTQLEPLVTSAVAPSGAPCDAASPSVAAAAEASSPPLDSPPLLLKKFAPVKICVFGSGAFGTALSVVLARKGLELCILTRRAEVAEAICQTHKCPTSSIPEMVLPFNISATTSAARALAGAAYILHCIPVQESRAYLAALREVIPPTLPIIVTSKGLHCESLHMMTELIPEALGRATHPVICLSGPTFAQELMKGFPSGAVAACADTAMAARVAELFSAPTMRVYTTTDVVGVELAGALKNVYAIAAGTLEGLGLGLNSTALLTTRAVQEMSALAIQLGGRRETLAGLSGIGDLVLTCFGQLSRNRSVGVRLGRGETIADITASMREVAEGVKTAPAALRLARQAGVRAPIVEAVCGVLDGRLEPLPALMALLALPAGEEIATAGGGGAAALFGGVGGAEGGAK